MVKKETTTLESHQVRYLSPEFGYFLVRNKFSTYMYYIVLLPVNHWKFDIPLIATEKNRLTYISFFQACLFKGASFGLNAKTRRYEYVGIETLVKPYSPAWQFCTTGITSCKGPIIGEFMQGRVEVRTLGTRMDNEPEVFMINLSGEERKPSQVEWK